MITDLRQVSLFQDIPEEGINRIMLSLKTRVYRKNQVIIYEQDQNTDVFIIRSGSIKIYSMLEDKEIIFMIGFAGTVIGEIEAIHHNDLRIASNAAMETTHTWYLKKQDFLQFVKEYPSILRRAYDLMVNNLKVLNRKVQYLSFLDIRLKAANLIYDLQCNIGKQVGSTYVVDYKLTHHVIANMIGSTRESVSKVLRDLQDEGIISIEHKTISILDLNQLKAICGELRYDSSQQRMWN